jgi:hypothetical protein
VLNEVFEEDQARTEDVRGVGDRVGRVAHESLVKANVGSKNEEMLGIDRPFGERKFMRRAQAPPRSAGAAHRRHSGSDRGIGQQGKPLEVREQSRSQEDPRENRESCVEM